jgi:hypothetical protein
MISLAHTGCMPNNEAAYSNPPIPENKLPIVIPAITVSGSFSDVLKCAS